MAERFVSDIFTEVDEEVRREQLKKLWERYGNYIVAAALLVIAAVAAWRGYDYWQTRRAAEAGAAYDAAARLADQGKHGEAEEALAQPSGAFRHSARELLALAAWRNGDTAAVRRWAEAAKNDPEAPASVRSRMDRLASLLPESGKP